MGRLWEKGSQMEEIASGRKLQWVAETGVQGHSLEEPVAPRRRSLYLDFSKPSCSLS